MFFPFVKLMNMGGLLRDIMVGVDNIDKILYKEEISEKIDTKIPQDTSIEFEDVTFSYGDRDVLKNVSFKALPKSVTALVGPSGAGKSTIGQLCARFWDIQTGTIKIGGIYISDLKLKTLMDNVSFVFQDRLWASYYGARQPGYTNVIGKRRLNHPLPA